MRALLAGALVNADQRGIHSHGTLRVRRICAKAHDGGVDPRGRPSLASDNGAALVVDARNAMGQIAADFAMTSRDRARPDHPYRRRRGRATAIIAGRWTIGPQWRSRTT